MTTHKLGGMNIRVFDPVVVARSADGETRWGYHQFPTISRLPDGRLLVTYNDCPDRDDAYGTPGPARVSADEGKTWVEWDSPEPLLTISHSVISPVYEDQHLCVPVSPSMDFVKNQIQLPTPAARIDVYGEVVLYRVSECPPIVQSHMTSLPGVRWSPATRAWEKEPIQWDMRDALIRTRKWEHVIPRPFIDNRILQFDGVLLYPVFHQQYLLPDGGCPKNYAATCMISKDNGRSWNRHGLIAHDPSGETMMGEPCLFPTSEGDLACVIRCADQTQKPMRITYSSDGGRTWAESVPLGEFGVMPQGLLLDNGVAVLSYGRPGVHLQFSPHGTAREWVGPVSLIEGDRNAIDADSCGYTRLLPVSEDTFLIAYSDFKHPTGNGHYCKAILVRQIKVSRG